MPSTAEQKAVAKFFLEVVQPKTEALDEAAAIKWNVHPGVRGIPKPLEVKGNQG